MTDLEVCVESKPLRSHRCVGASVRGILFTIPCIMHLILVRPKRNEHPHHLILRCVEEVLCAVLRATAEAVDVNDRRTCQPCILHCTPLFERLTAQYLSLGDDHQIPGPCSAQDLRWTHYAVTKADTVTSQSKEWKLAVESLGLSGTPMMAALRRLGHASRCELAADDDDDDSQACSVHARCFYW